MAGSGDLDDGGELLALVVRDHLRRIEDGLAPALADAPDAVHQLRTTVRRLRNVLAGFRSTSDRPAAHELRDRLHAFGDVLGEVRDLEVRAALAGRLGGGLALPPEAQAALVDDVLTARRTAHARLRAWWETDEADELRSCLTAWDEAPALGPKATRSARKTARKAVLRQADRALRAAAGIDLVLLAERPDAELAHAHELRKAGRRLRHVVDAVTGSPADVLGGKARRLGKVGHRLQSDLGDHRDACQVAATALMLAEEAARDGRPRAPYDAVAAAARRAGRVALDGVADAVTELRIRRDEFAG